MKTWRATEVISIQSVALGPPPSQSGPLPCFRSHHNYLLRAFCMPDSRCAVVTEGRHSPFPDGV